MAYTHYDRLTALDASFLELESESVHMHVGSVGIFDPGPTTDGTEGVDFDALERVEFFLNESLVATLFQPPFEQPLKYFCVGAVS